MSPNDHLTMNVCDCYKDAKAGTTATSSQLFIDSIKLLFPRFTKNANMKTLHDLEDKYLPPNDSQWNRNSFAQSLGPRPLLPRPF